MKIVPLRLATYVVIILLGLIAPYIFPAFKSQMTELWLFIVFALTWDLVGGQMGYNSFGNVVFLGIGMYACVVLQVALYYDVGAYNAARGGGTIFSFNDSQYMTGLALGLPLAGLIAGAAAVFLGSIVLGMRGHYFAICTLGLGIAAAEIASGWGWIGAGSGMDAPQPRGHVDIGELIYYLSMGLAVITFAIMAWLYTTRFGLSINAIRDDEDKAEAMGLPTTRIKVMAWTICAILLGMAGGLYGNLKKFIDPFDVAFSGPTVGVWMILMAILGGKGTLWGPVIGAALFQIMKEVFWTYLLGWQRVALGVMIVVIVVFFPEGIIGWVKDRFAPRRLQPGEEGGT